MSLRRVPSAPYWFLSYSHLDLDWVVEIESAIQRSGLATWRDRNFLTEADLTNEEALCMALEYAIRYSSGALFCASRHAISSRWMEWEFETACRLDIPTYFVSRPNAAMQSMVFYE